MSFGTVRIHKITQGIDPPSSSQDPSEFSDSDLLETGLFAVDTFEYGYRSPGKRPSRTRLSSKMPTELPCDPPCGDHAGCQDAQTSLNSKLAAVGKIKASYRIVKTVGDEYPGNVLMAHEVSPRRASRRRDSIQRLPK